MGRVTVTCLIKMTRPLAAKITLRTKLTCTFLYTPAHTQTGMRVAKVKVEHMMDRLYIHHNYCLQDINWKTGLEHLTPLEEIKARPNFDILTEYQMNKVIW